MPLISSTYPANMNCVSETLFQINRNEQQIIQRQKVECCIPNNNRTNNQKTRNVFTRISIVATWLFPTTIFGVVILWPKKQITVYLMCIYIYINLQHTTRQTEENSLFCLNPLLEYNSMKCWYIEQKRNVSTT